jgi:hypothetical protein
MNKLYIVIFLFFLIPSVSEAHRSGCHRWHSCPSDSGSYTCGDAGYPCRYPTYPASGGVIYPPSGYYKDCYTCATKKVPTGMIGKISDALRNGSENETVKTLQLGLVKDGVYPTAIVSGFYGTLTEEAVKKFQAKYGIVSSGTPDTTGYGNFGPKTQAKFNELYGGE